MAERLSWQETKRDGGASVSFVGPPAPAARAWAGASAVVVACVFAYLAFFAPNAKPVTREPWFRVAPIVLALAGVSLVVTDFPGISAGTLDVDRQRVRIDPQPSWRLRVEVPLAKIDYVATESGEATGTGRFRVRVTLRDGSRATLATFGEADAALFMSQRLEALLDRARASRV